MKNLAYLQSLKGMNLLIWLETKALMKVLTPTLFIIVTVILPTQFLLLLLIKYFIHISEARKMGKVWNFSKSYISEFLGIDF